MSSLMAEAGSPASIFVEDIELSTLDLRTGQ
jgi:hypothetical protein